MVGYEIITFQRIYSNASGSVRLIIQSIVDFGVKPDEQEFQKVNENLTEERDQKIFQVLTELVKQCWNSLPEARPTALQGNNI